MNRDSDRLPGVLRPETRALIRCLDRGDPPGEGVVRGFGLLTPAHVDAARSALTRGEVTPAEVNAAWRDAAELLRLFGSAPSSRFAALAFWVPPDDLPPDRAAAAFAVLGEQHRRFSASAWGQWLGSLAHADRAGLLEEELSAWAENLGIGHDDGVGPAGGAS